MSEKKPKKKRGPGSVAVTSHAAPSRQLGRSVGVPPGRAISPHGTVGSVREDIYRGMGLTQGGPRQKADIIKAADFAERSNAGTINRLRVVLDRMFLSKVSIGTIIPVISSSPAKVEREPGDSGDSDGNGHVTETAKNLAAESNLGAQALGLKPGIVQSLMWSSFLFLFRSNPSRSTATVEVISVYAITPPLTVLDDVPKVKFIRKGGPYAFEVRFPEGFSSQLIYRSDPLGFEEESLSLVWKVLNAEIRKMDEQITTILSSEDEKIRRQEQEKAEERGRFAISFAQNHQGSVE